MDHIDEILQKMLDDPVFSSLIDVVITVSPAVFVILVAGLLCGFALSREPVRRMDFWKVIYIVAGVAIFVVFGGEPSVARIGLSLVIAGVVLIIFGERLSATAARQNLPQAKIRRETQDVLTGAILPFIWDFITGGRGSSPEDSSDDPPS